MLVLPTFQSIPMLSWQPFSVS